eukprot:tig00021339_g20395.t1
MDSCRAARDALGPDAVRRARFALRALRFGRLFSRTVPPILCKGPASYVELSSRPEKIHRLIYDSHGAGETRYLNEHQGIVVCFRRDGSRYTNYLSFRPRFCGRGTTRPM